VRALVAQRVVLARVGVEFGAAGVRQRREQCLVMVLGGV
jgi:hypothetical protein